MHVLAAPKKKTMPTHVFNLLQTKLYVFLILAVYFSGASTNHGATISYAYYRW